MKRITSWCLQLVSCFVLAAAIATPAQAADDKKVDPTGTWTWTTQGRNGGEPRESTLKIKKEGEKLVGTLKGMQGNETELKNLKLTGEEITFDVTREFQGNARTMKYKGKVGADTITGKISGERDGQTTERDWTAKRKTEEKK